MDSAVSCLAFGARGGPMGEIGAFRLASSATFAPNGWPMLAGSPFP